MGSLKRLWIRVFKSLMDLNEPFIEFIQPLCGPVSSFDSWWNSVSLLNTINPRETFWAIMSSPESRLNSMLLLSHMSLSELFSVFSEHLINYGIQGAFLSPGALFDSLWNLMSLFVISWKTMDSERLLSAIDPNSLMSSFKSRLNSVSLFSAIEPHSRLSLSEPFPSQWFFWTPRSLGSHFDQFREPFDPYLHLVSVFIRIEHQWAILSRFWAPVSFFKYRPLLTLSEWAF